MAHGRDWPGGKVNVAAVLPAFRPGTILIDCVRELAATDIPLIVVIDDGSGAEFAHIFDSVSATSPKVRLLRHTTNKGKGAALKTGFRYIQSEPNSFAGVVTADADGQHAVPDILAVARQTETRTHTLVLGVRRFGAEVPLRSVLGNRITLLILRAFFRLDLSDSQTGLRGISADLLGPLVAIRYDRYEYELEMLLLLRRLGVTIHEVPIATIYLDNNKASHFNPLIDSTRIYFVLFRYVIASALTALVDYTSFLLLIGPIRSILLCTLLSRSVALGVNYSLLRTAVFQSRERASSTFPKYVALVVLTGLVSALLTQTLVSTLAISVVIAKASSELLLYILVFWAQKMVIFRPSPGNNS